MGQRVSIFFSGLRYPVAWLWALLFIIAAVACIFLGFWQWERAEIRAAAVEEQARTERASADPVEFTQTLQPQEPFTEDIVGLKAEVSGTFTPEHGYIVTNRVNGTGDVGQLVVADLVVDASGGRLPVVVGWIPTVEQGQAILEQLPSGSVDVEGFLQASEAAGDDPVSDGIGDAISSAELVNWWGAPIYSGYLTANVTDPDVSHLDDELQALPLPTKHGVGLNLQNLGYALQWWVFAVFAIAIWIRMVYDHAKKGEEVDESTTA